MVLDDAPAAMSRDNVESTVVRLLIGLGSLVW